MRVIDYSLLDKRTWNKDVLNYVALIHEYKGRQQLYLKQKPEVLDKLVVIAKRQSTEASNEIEGIRVNDARLKQLMLDTTTPKTRSEEEILGYRNVLSLIHENYDSIPLTSNYILQLHKEMCRFTNSNDGGKFKESSNVIEDTTTKRVIFKPVDPYLVPILIDKLCEEYNFAINQRNIDPLVVIPIFIHDFLCIHPFRDGNGRMSRLLTTLLLYKSGYYVGKYVSLEKKIQITKEDYYVALEKSSVNWHKNENDDTPFIQYLLGTFIAAYRDFEDRVSLVGEKLSAKELVLRAVNMKIGKFTKSDIMELCPEIGDGSVENMLKKLCEEHVIEKHGGGRSTYYTRIDV